MASSAFQKFKAGMNKYSGDLARREFWDAMTGAVPRHIGSFYHNSVDHLSELVDRVEQGGLKAKVLNLVHESRQLDVASIKDFSIKLTFPLENYWKDVKSFQRKRRGNIFF